MGQILTPPLSLVCSMDPSQFPHHSFPHLHRRFHANPTSYPEMIRTAITTLGDTNGSSKKAISNFIEQNYPNLPSAHPDLLAPHLDILQSHGLLVMYNKCYKLPLCDHSSPSTPQRKRGRPPKISPEDEPTRGPGRPPIATANIKVIPLSDNTGTSSLPTVKSLRRGRGRPRKNAAPLAVGVGQPNKLIPFAGTVSPDNSLYIEKSSRRRGRPKKNASSLPKMGTSVEDELRSKLKCFQFKVNESLSVIKLHFCNTSPVNALAAIRELDRIATMDLDAPL